MIKRNLLFPAMLIFVIACSGPNNARKAKGWVRLFDGESLSGWKASEAPGSFKVQNGSIVVAGPRSHLYYEGEVMHHDFRNFEFKAQVMTMPGSNSGVYFHTQYQEKGFPDKGFEVQVNNSHRDWKRTAGLYDVQDTRDVYAKDSVWFTLYFKVQGNRITSSINDKTVIDYTEPENAVAPRGHPGRLISRGTFALQAHDPKSVVLYKDIMVKPLP